MGELNTTQRVDYDHIVRDMPQGVAERFRPALIHVARVVLVNDTSLPSVKRTHRLIDLIRAEHMTLPVEVVIANTAAPTKTAAAFTLPRPAPRRVAAPHAPLRQPAALDPGRELKQQLDELLLEILNLSAFETVGKDALAKEIRSFCVEHLHTQGHIMPLAQFGALIVNLLDGVRGLGPLCPCWLTSPSAIPVLTAPTSYSSNSAVC